MTRVDDLAQWAPYLLGAFLLISALRAFQAAATGTPPRSWNQEGERLSRSRRIAGFLFGLIALSGALLFLLWPEWMLQKLGR